MAATHLLPPLALHPPSHPPSPCQVGLVTFGTHVHVHEIGFSECPRAYVFRGSKDYSAAQVGGWRLRGRCQAEGLLRGRGGQVA